MYKYMMLNYSESKSVPFIKGEGGVYLGMIGHGGALELDPPPIKFLYIPSAWKQYTFIYYKVIDGTLSKILYKHT